MTVSALKALHRRQEHANPAAESRQAPKQSLPHATRSNNVISSVPIDSQNRTPAQKATSGNYPSNMPSSEHGAATEAHNSPTLSFSSTSSLSSSSSPWSASATPFSSSTSANSTLSNISSAALPSTSSSPPTSRSSSTFKILPIKKRSSSKSAGVSANGARSRASSGSARRNSNVSNISGDVAATQATSRPPAAQRFPSRVELREQYDRHGRLVRAVEEMYDHDATMPCLAYGTPVGPIGSDAFGRPPPYM